MGHCELHSSVSGRGSVASSCKGRTGVSDELLQRQDEGQRRALAKAGRGSVASSCKNGSGQSSFIKFRKFLGELRKVIKNNVL